MKKQFIYLPTLFLLIVLSLSCDNSNQNNSNTNNLVNVDIGYSRLRISLPIFVAKEKGLFEKHGINANLLMYETAQPLMQGLIEGKVDAAGYTALPITLNGMIRSKKELLFLTTMTEDQKHKISYLLVSKDSEIKTISDLKGKIIGILPTIAYKAWIEEILKNNGINPKDDVIIQQVAPNQQAQALQSKGVDALFTNDPAATTTLQLDIARQLTTDVLCPLYVYDYQGFFPFGSFNISKEWASNNPETVKSIKAALNEAITLINNNQQEAKFIMQNYLPSKFKEHVAFYPDAKYLTTIQNSPEMYKEIVQSYYDIGIIPELINLDHSIVN